MSATLCQPHPAIAKYLTELETSLRQMPGVDPGEALADAHEFLQSEWESFGGAESPLSAEELYLGFVARFGPPDEVAAAYARAAEPAKSTQAIDAGDTRRQRHWRTTSAPIILSVLVALGATAGVLVWKFGAGAPAGNTSAAPVRQLTWASRVTSFAPGSPASTVSADPQSALGAPDCDGDHRHADKYVALGVGGELVLEFSGLEFCDGDGPDLSIVEIGPLAEPFDVAVSRDGSSWLAIGRAKGADVLIDLAPLNRPGEPFRFVRLVDAKGVKAAKNKWPGADIDAVGAFYVIPAR